MISTRVDACYHRLLNRLLLTGTQLFLIEDGQPIDTSMDYRGITVLEEHVDQVLVLVPIMPCQVQCGLASSHIACKEKVLQRGGAGEL